MSTYPSSLVIQDYKKPDYMKLIKANELDKKLYLININLGFNIFYNHLSKRIPI